MNKDQKLRYAIYFLLFVFVSIGCWRFLKQYNGDADGISSEQDITADIDSSSATSSSDAQNVDSSNESGVINLSNNSGGDDATSNDKAGNVPKILTKTSTKGQNQSVDQSSDSDVIAPTVNDSSEVIPSSSLTLIAPQVCSWANVSTSSRSILLNEIAWMGTLPESGDTTAKASDREWIELKNNSSATIDLTNWQILSSSGNLKIMLGNGGADGEAKILPGGFYLLVRGGGLLPNYLKGDSGYSGTLSNAGDQLALLDPHCEVSDFIDASSGWPGGSNTTKQTLERDVDGLGWHTSAPAGGTPRAENSTPAPPPQYIITVSEIGGGSGIVSSSPSGIFCGPNCEADFASGTNVQFSAVSAVGSVFKGWSGVCSGSVSAICSVTISSSIALVARFDSMTISQTPSTTQEIQEAPMVSVEDGAGDGVGGGLGSSVSSGTSANNSLDHLVISAVQISAASSSNDFVKIFNPTSVAVDMSGWKIHKKSSTGTDYSLKSLAMGTVVAPSSYFVWANSTGGFADAIRANASSTETLSADNSVALIDANGNTIDAVAWGAGINQYVEGDPYPTDPSAGQILIRKVQNGISIDTNNNANDFMIQ